MPGRDNELDWRPAISDQRREPYAIYPWWHVNIGEDNADIKPVFQDLNRLGGVGSFDCRETCTFHHIDGCHSQQWVVLNNKNYWF